MPEISALPSPDRALDGSEIVPIYQDSFARQATLTQILALNDNSAILDELVNMTTPYPVSANTVLTVSQIGSWIIVAASGNILINLPPATSASIGAQVLLSVSSGSLGVVTVQAAPSSGFYISGEPLQDFVFNDSALFVFDGTEWKMPILRRTPLAGEMLNTAALALTIGQFTYLPLGLGSQETDTPFTGWFATDHFVAPRDGIYIFEADLWFSGTGAPAQVDLGFTVGSLTGVPNERYFARINVTADTYQSLKYARSIRVTKGQSVAPTIRPFAPLTVASIIAPGSLLSRFAFTEVPVS